MLRNKGYNAPASGRFDEATQAAVAKFQADHGIPFPTGRQAGPKTLSTLDDHLLGGGGGGGNKTAEVPTAFGPDVKTATQDREGKLKEKPEGAPSIAARKTVPAEEDDDGILQGKFQVGYGALWNVNSLRNPDGTTDSGGFGEFCESGTLQGGLTLNITGFRLGDRWRMFGSFEVSANTAPTLCSKRPAVEGQVEVLKFEMTKWAEVSLMGMLGVEGPPTGLLTGAGLEIEVKPFQKVPALQNWSIVGSANGSYLWQPASPETPGQGTPQLGGTIGLSATWDFIPAPKKK